MKSFQSLIPINHLQSLDEFLKLYFSPKANYFNFESEQYTVSDNINSDSKNGINSNYLVGYTKLMESINYSLFTGGKRFRPMVGYLLGEALGISADQLTPWLAAIECIHTYSLIHDDLPCMDNDTLRRGKPTNHVVFGETTALLAGDALLTEAFKIIAEYYVDSPPLGLPLVGILSRASGVQGMVAGQALDLGFNVTGTNLKNILGAVKMIHHLKTGALIASVAQGVALFTSYPQEIKNKIHHFGFLLGFNFQVKDDLLDFDTQVNDPKNIAQRLGVEKTKELLVNNSNLAKEALHFLTTEKKSALLELIDYNVHRTT